MIDYKQHSSFPCLHCQPHGYIRMVQNLIERCLVLRMDRDRCIKALAEHANIPPLVTLTVWRGLLKENRDFFQGYIPMNFSSRHDMRRASRFRRTKPWN